MSEYHKIETLFARDEKTFKVIPTQLRDPVYGIIKTWQWTEKIDGTNIRCMWSDGKLTFGGRTDNASIPAPLMNWLMANITAEKMTAAFGLTASVVLYGEGYGGKIQQGTGYASEQQFILFDVFVAPKFWLADENMRNVAQKLGIPAVPRFDDMSLEAAVDFVAKGFVSRISIDPLKKAEGLVGRTERPLFNAKSERLIVKLKTKDF